MAPNYPEIWAEMAEAVSRPESLIECGDAVFSSRVKALRDHAALPLVLFDLGETDYWQALSADRRARLAWEEARYKAAAAVLWGEFEGILDRWASADLTPCLLKGAHAALAFYPAAHLRPMSDVDVLFADLSEAERAFQLLIMMGYKETTVELGGDHWATHHHLTPLENRATGFTIEVHGSIIYPPRDNRAHALGCLWKKISLLTVNGRKVRALSPEAFIVITLAHAIVAHGAEAPKFQAILDVAQVLRVTGASFRWERLQELSVTTGFAGAVSTGLRWTEELLGSAIPESFIARLEHLIDEGAMDLGLTGEDYNNARFLATIRQSESLRAKMDIVRHLTLPSKGWMRVRYPEKARWPAWALYPYRWANQTRKVIKVLWVRRSS